MKKKQEKHSSKSTPSHFMFSLGIIHEHEILSHLNFLSKQFSLFLSFVSFFTHFFFLFSIQLMWVKILLYQVYFPPHFSVRANNVFKKVRGVLSSVLYSFLHVPSTYGPLFSFSFFLHSLLHTQKKTSSLFPRISVHACFMSAGARHKGTDAKGEKTQ